jgi:AP-1 complex subunit gamma-1
VLSNEGVRPSSFQKFVESLILASTIEDERVLITEELASMRTLSQDCSDRHRPGLVAKLLYLGTIGCDTAWGQMEAVGLMAHDRPSFKRVGYLTVAQMFDESNERVVLITSTVQKDLQNTDTSVQRLALTLVVNLCSSEMAQSVISDVVRLHTLNDFVVRKCVGLAALRILRRPPRSWDTSTAT